MRFVFNIIRLRTFLPQICGAPAILAERPDIHGFGWFGIRVMCNSLLAVQHVDQRRDPDQSAATD